MVHVFGGTPASEARGGAMALATASTLLLYLSLAVAPASTAQAAGRVGPTDACLWVALVLGALQAHTHRLAATRRTWRGGSVAVAGAVAVSLVSLTLRPARPLETVAVSGAWQGAVEGTLAGLTVLTCLVGESQRPYVLCQSLRNPCHVDPSRPGDAYTRACRVVYRACWFALPPVMLGYLVDGTYLPSVHGEGTGAAWGRWGQLGYAVLMLRSFRWVWQAPIVAATELSLMILVMRASPALARDALQALQGAGGTGDVHLAFFLVSLGFDRVIRFAKKCWFHGTILLEFLVRTLIKGHSCSDGFC